MKKILLLSLLFIPLFCSGQTSIKIEDKKIYRFYIEEYTDSYGNTVVIDSMDLISLKTLQLYQQECYKDSIKLGPYGSLSTIPYSTIQEKYKDYYPNLDSYSISNQLNPVGFRKIYNSLKQTECEKCCGKEKVIYLHRTPTFEGFLKYLEE